LNLKTPSFIFSNLFLIPRTLFPDYIYKISQNMGERRMKMNNEIREVMENVTTMGKKVSFRPRNGRENTLEGKVVEEVSVILDNNDKHFIQKIKGTDNKYYYRHCYYVWSEKSQKPVFGQFASTIPEKNIKNL
jgi:hypothetical protein